MKKVFLVMLAVVSISTSSFAAGTNPNKVKSNSSKTNKIAPIALAVAKGNSEAVATFIKFGADVDQKTNGMTALMYAARYNRVDLIKVLLENGANVSEKSYYGFTALQIAEQSNAKEAAELLSTIK